MLIRLLCIEYGVSDRQEAMAVWYDGRRFWATNEIAPQKGAPAGSRDWKDTKRRNRYRVVVGTG
jgi:hypothetical protein